MRSTRRPSPAAGTAVASRPLVSHRVAFVVAAVGALAIALPAMLYHIGDLPIVQWDEARVAGSAQEMARTGFSLAPTWLGQVDHWYVKPPLTVWMAAASILAVGSTELAVRLPSVLAALATGLVVFGLVGVFLRRPFAGFVAIAVLFSSAGYLDFHGVRAGDIEASLTFLTTLWIAAAFLYLEDIPERRHLWLTVCALAIGLDFLDKSIQGLIPLPAVFIYAAWRGRLRATLSDRGFWVAVGSVAIVAVAYFGLREMTDPGYAAAAIGRDIFDRTSSAIEGHVGPPTFYLEYAVAGMFGHPPAFPLLLPSIVALGVLAWLGPPGSRPLARYLLVVLVVYLGVLSVITTKIMWYIIPLLPLAAMGVGLSVDAVAQWIARAAPTARRLVDGAMILGAVVLVAVIVANNMRSVDRRIAGYLVAPEYRTALFLRDSLSASDAGDFVIADDPGFMPDYFYARPLFPDGVQPKVQSPNDALPPGTSKVAACGQAVDAIRARGYLLAPLVTDRDCGLFAVAPGAGS